ncbi:hypothetical protein Psfp_01898 [Pelotomaculum sp. FP]|nr:hypothetical protein Psfp_01898 [Pelotomaculum sp. FP]
MYFDHTYLFSLGHQVVDGLFSGIADRSHGHDDVFGVRISVIIKRFIFPAGDLADFLHILIYDIGDWLEERAASLSGLEENIRVLVGAPDNRAVRIQAVVPECLDSVHVNQFGKIIIIDDLYLLLLVGSSETIIEVQERYPGLDGGQVGDATDINNFLNTVGAQ